MGFNYKQNRAWAEHLHIVLQLGLTMIGCIALFFFIGRYLDSLLGTEGIMVAIFTILGVIGGAVTAYRQILETLNDDRHNGNAS